MWEHLLVGTVGSVSLIAMATMCMECKKGSNRPPTTTQNQNIFDNFGRDPDVEVIYNPHSGALELAPSSDKHKYDSRELPIAGVIINSHVFEGEQQKGEADNNEDKHGTNMKSKSKTDKSATTSDSKVNIDPET